MARVPQARSLAALRPDLAEEWHPVLNGDLTPYDVTCGLTRKVWWVCAAGHPYDAAVGHRAGNGSGCPFCSNKRALAGYNDLATTHPELAVEWAPDAERRPRAERRDRWGEQEAVVAVRGRPRVGGPVESQGRAAPGRLPVLL